MKRHPLWPTHESWRKEWWLWNDILCDQHTSRRIFFVGIFIKLLSSVQAVCMCSEMPMCAPPRLSEVSPTFLWNSSSVCPTDDGPLSSFQRTSSSAFSFNASLLQVIDSVMSLALCPRLVSEAPQHFRSSETQATCQGCFARQSICLVIALHSDMSRAVHPEGFSKSGVWAFNSTFDFL